jgi:hypothetical protein
MRILADSMRLAQPTAPRVHARVRSGVPISISISFFLLPQRPTLLPLKLHVSCRDGFYPAGQKGLASAPFTPSGALLKALAVTSGRSLQV